MNIQETWQKYHLKNKPIEIRNQLVEHYYKFMLRCVKKMKYYIHMWNDKDDLSGYAAIGLISAVEGFDPEYDNKFETFASKKIWYAMIDGLREFDYVPRRAREKIKKGEIKFKIRNLLEDSDRCDFSWNNIKEVHSYHQDFMFYLYKEELYRLISELSLKKRDIILRHLDMKTDRKISEEIGCTISNVVRIRVDTVSMLKEKLQKF